MKVWLDTGLVEASIAGVSQDGWPDGEGIFETIKTEGGDVYELGRHMRRALASANNLELRLPSEENIREAIQKLMSVENFAIGRLRLFFAKGRFIAVHQRYDEVTEPARLMVFADRGTLRDVSIKKFPYKHRLDLLSQAKARGCTEAILLNEKEEVTEGAVSNFLFRIDGKWVTTPLSSGVLPGVQRGIVIERCGVAVKSISKSDLMLVDAAFVISSLKIALPVSNIDGRALQIDRDCAALEADIRAKTFRHSVG